LEKYQRVRKEGTLLLLDFTTVKEYLFLLRDVTKILAPFNERVMFYLAAAVSDFYIPDSKIVEHKIQSSDGGLCLTLAKVPKILKPLVREWAPRGLVVSFKLETDDALLGAKARGSLEVYGHQIVIGNILATRKKRVVVLYQGGGEKVIELGEREVEAGVEIEGEIVSELVVCHRRWMNR
jgi:phosphopantothenate-cysteine ligase